MPPIFWPRAVVLGAVLSVIGQIPTSEAFTYIDSETMASRIVHVSGYNGVGGHYALSVGIAPTSVHASAMVTPTLNALTVWNQLAPTVNNVTLNALSGSQLDYESVLLHELGHALGLDHPNQADRDNSNARYAASTKGSDALFTYSAGADGKAGSSDDLRSDDVSLNWFQKGVNDPWTLATTIDTTTYSQSASDLPSGQTYAAIATRENDASVSSSGYRSETAMVQGVWYNEIQRTLGADDVAGIRFAMSGKDGLQGTSDDYTFSLVYAGLTTSADITLDFGSSTGVAGTTVGVQKLIGSANHYAATDSSIVFSTSYSWYFNSVLIPEPASLVLLGLGAFLLIPTNRKRRHLSAAGIK